MVMSAADDGFFCFSGAHKPTLQSTKLSLALSLTEGKRWEIGQFPNIRNIPNFPPAPPSSHNHYRLSREQPICPGRYHF